MIIQKFLLGLWLCLTCSSLIADTATPTEIETTPALQTLSKFVGHWEGRSADGHFKEITNYRWGDGNSHLLLDMIFYMDEVQTGTASGFFAWNESTDGLVFHLVSSQGVVITQQQILSDGKRIEMKAQTINGANVGFPPDFRSAFIIGEDGTYDSEVLMPAENGGWQVVMRNHFERVDK
jgi:hypothetical protein